MPFRCITRSATALIISFALIGCQSIREAENQGQIVQDTPPSKTRGAGSFKPKGSILSGENSLKDKLLGSSENSNVLPVNKYLWRASLDTLGESLPLASTDPFSGIITTDWGASPSSPNERVRVTASVEGKELSARALDVAVFRETLNPAGAWISAAVNPATAEQLKNAIILRARELRIQDVDGTAG